MSDLAAEDAVFCVDTGEVTLWTAGGCTPRGQQQITGSFNNAAVGVALGMANGIQALDTHRQVIAMCGDGGFTMLMQEFVTSAQHGLPVKVFVFNNSGWGAGPSRDGRSWSSRVHQGGAIFKKPGFAMFASLWC